MTTSADCGTPDGEIVRRVLAGDRESFRLLVRRHELVVRSFLASQLYRLDDVDDLAQETFVAAFKSLPAFNPEQAFGPWLRGVARHLLHSHFRSKVRQDNALQSFRLLASRVVADELEAVFAHESSTQIELLLQCIDKLPERMTHVVRAGLKGLRSSVIAEELSTTVSAVYNLQYRANQILRRCVEERISHE